MRILIVTSHWFPAQDGVARVATETARKLAERGNEITVLAPRLDEAEAATADGALDVRPVFGPSRLPSTLARLVATTRHARRLRPPRHDVLVAHGSTTAVGLLAARLDRPLVLVHHASLPRELRFVRPRLPFGLRRLAAYGLEPPLVLIERTAVRHASRIAVLSDYNHSLLRSDHPGSPLPVRRVSGGVDVDTFAPGEMSVARERLGIHVDGPLLVSVRRLEPRMGLEQLLHAVRRLADSHNVHLAIVGGGMLEQELPRLSSELGLDGRVRFVGRVPDVELPDWYRAADLFVLPTVAYEGFGMVTAEALASGTPVVGTPVGATPELLEALDARLVARGSDVEALTDAITGALALVGPTLRRRCREYARERFSWDAVIPHWEDVLREAVAEPVTQ